MNDGTSPFGQNHRRTHLENESTRTSSPQSLVFAFNTSISSPLWKDSSDKGLPAQQRHDGEAHQEIIDRMGQDAGRETSGFFIDPGPKHAAPADADQTDRTIAMCEPENACADEGGREKAELAPQNGEQQTSKGEFFEKRRKDDILQQTDHGDGWRSPDQISIEPFSPVARQMPLFRQASHNPFAPQTGSDNRKNRDEKPAEVPPGKTQTETFFEGHPGRPEQVIVG